MHNANKQRLNREEWQHVMSLFSDVCDLPESDRDEFINAAGLSDRAATKLGQMLATLGQTMSLIDVPLTERLTLESGWYETNWAGRQLDEFHLHTLLQEGAIAGVFLAAQKEPVERQVVIKLLRPDAPAEYQQLFRFEQKALAKLSHPNIAQIIDVRSSDEGMSYIVMEHIEGQELSDYCADQALGIDDRLVLFLQVCDAVNYCHQRGILHRDLKPSNILVREFDGVPTPTLIDFGISSELNDRFSAPGDRLLGTPEYMSPEHVLNASDLDARADVYSLGMVLFTLLVGRIPFDRTSLITMDKAPRLALIAEFEPPVFADHLRTLTDDDLDQVATERSTSPTRLLKQTRSELSSIFSKAVTKDKEHRYQTVTALAADIRRQQANHPVEVHSDSLPYRVGRFVQRHAIASAAAAIIIGLGVIFLSKLIEQNIRIKQEAQKAAAERQNAERVASMITETFGFADPNNAARKGQASVTDMLDHGYRNLMRTKGLTDDVRASLLLSLSDAFRESGLYEYSREIENTLLHELDLEDPLLVCRSLQSASRTAEATAQLARQLETAEQANAACSGQKFDANIEIQSYLILARALDLHDRYDEAAGTLRQAESLHNEMFDSPTPLLADIHQSLAAIEFGLQNIESATEHYLRAQEIISQSFADDHARSVSLELDVYRHLCYTQQEACTTERGNRLYENVLKVWTDGSRQEVEVLNIQATTNFYNELYEQASDQIEKSLETLELLGERQGMDYLRALAFLSTIYLFMQDHERALEVSTRAFDLVAEIQASGALVSGRNMAFTQMRHAYALAANRRFDEASELVNAAIDYHKSNNAQRGNGLEIGLILRSVMRTEMGDFDGATTDVDALEVVIGNNAPGDDQELLVVEVIRLYAELRANWNDARFTALVKTRNAHVNFKRDQAQLPPHTLIREFIAAHQ